MKKQYMSKRASEQEITLYCYMGESVIAVQHLEDCLSHSIVLKSLQPALRSEADTALTNYRSYTLGRAIKFAEKNKIYSESLVNQLREFLSERNWLIHKSIAQSRDKWDSAESRGGMLLRIKTVSQNAFVLSRKIEEDLIKFAEENGIDMTRVKAAIENYYSES